MTLVDGLPPIPLQDGQRFVELDSSEASAGGNARSFVIGILSRPSRPEVVPQLRIASYTSGRWLWIDVPRGLALRFFPDTKRYFQTLQSTEIK